MIKKKLRHKLCIDPLPFLEYFIPEDPASIDLAKMLIGHGELKEALNHHTVNPDYARSIANKLGYPQYVPKHTVVDPVDVRRLLSQPMSEICKTYLLDRKFPIELIPTYEMSSWLYHEGNGYNSLSDYFPFCYEEMEYASFKLSKLGFIADLSKQDMLVMPSYDRKGILNNLVFRFVDDHISTICAKWLFSHGRQATFGLHKIDPEKPVYVVEGFFDHVACDQMGMQSVGLGSAFISDEHWKQFKDLKLVFILDSDEAGTEHSSRLREQGHKVWMLKDYYKDPYEYWVNGEELSFY
jgi:hypothetical protein